MWLQCTTYRDFDSQNSATGIIVIMMSGDLGQFVSNVTWSTFIVLLNIWETPRKGKPNLKTKILILCVVEHNYTIRDDASLCTLTHSGLDNKCSVYQLSQEEDLSCKKRAVAMHTSYVSCCTFMNSDQQVRAACRTWGFDRVSLTETLFLLGNLSSSSWFYSFLSLMFQFIILSCVCTFILAQEMKLRRVW